MTGIIGGAGSKSGVIGFHSIEIFTNGGAIISSASGVSLGDTDRFRMWKQSGIVFINATFSGQMIAGGNSQYITCGTLTAASGLRPNSDREIYGGVTGYGGDTAHSFQIFADGTLKARHVATVDVTGYMGINGFYII